MREGFGGFYEEGREDLGVFMRERFGGFYEEGREDLGVFMKGGRIWGLL